MRCYSSNENVQLEMEVAGVSKVISKKGKNKTLSHSSPTPLAGLPKSGWLAKFSYASISSSKQFAKRIISMLKPSEDTFL